MNEFAAAARDQRAALFIKTGLRMDLAAPIVEKDFWVCWLLKQLFTMKELEGWLVFKGGTSLSKCFNLIPRFSEDVDLAVDFEKLGFSGEKDPRRPDLSHTKREPLLRRMMASCQEYIAGPFLAAVRLRISEILASSRWALQVSTADANTIEFTYPTALDTGLAYVKPKVLLELGTHAEPIPRHPYILRPFAAEQFPNLFAEPACPVMTVVARRTFWEKATILHAEYHRPLDKPLLQRYSRHYADVAAMAQAPVKNEALADLGLLQDVVRHKDRFYHCGWARYFEATPGTFRLAPRNERIADLRQDLASMQVMYFGTPPTFDGVMERLAQLEQEINGLPL